MEGRLKYRGVVPDGPRATVPSRPLTLRCAVCIGSNQQLKPSPRLAAFAMPWAWGDLCAPHSLQPWPRCKSVKTGFPAGGSREGWRVPLPFPPSSLRGASAPGLCTDLCLPPSVRWTSGSRAWRSSSSPGLRELALALAAGAPSLPGWAPARERRGCSPRGDPAPPVLLPVRLSSCKATFLGA